MTEKNRRNTDKFYDSHPVWSSLNSLAIKVIPSLTAAAVIVVTAGAWSTYVSVNKLTDKVAQLETEVVSMRQKIDQVEANSVRRAELLEILKRVEQQLEIALLRSGIKVPSKMLSGDK